MLVSVYSPSNEKTFRLNIGPELTLINFKAMCSAESGISSANIQLLLNNQALSDDSRTLLSYKVCENDIIVVQPKVSQTRLNNTQSAGATPMKHIDFSRVQVPGSSTSQQNSGLESEINMLRNRFVNNPSHLALLKERNPALADALVKNDLPKITSEFQKIKDAVGRAEMEKINMLNANPMDPEVQRKIAAEIERKNIEENMNMAIEEAPESFGQVVMLWINLRVNGHHVKAFVDSGAQMTIMSTKCAERCNIMRLVDKRWAGIAMGVGTQKIIGRIHLAQIQIEDVFLQCSFSVLEDQPMEVLLGLDMLKRHLCVIDLRESTLTIGSSNTKTTFLPERELPSHGRLHDPNAEVDAKKKEEAEINQALLESAAAGSSQTNGNSSGEVPAKIAKPSSNALSAETENKLKQLVEMGFSRADSLAELEACSFDLQRTTLSLIMKKNFSG